MSDENIQKALCDIDSICCIYRSVGEAVYDEVRVRLAGRFGKRLDDLTARLAEAEAEREQYRMLAVSYGKTLRVSEASMDSIVTARLAQKRAAKSVRLA